MTSVVDTDILYKGSCYGLLSNLICNVDADTRPPAILGAAKFVVLNKLQKKPPQRGSDIAIAEFKAALSQMTILEPTEAEIELAANLEFEAQHLGAELDSGESLLCAIVAKRQVNCLLTGDKRAIAAIHSLIEKPCSVADDLRNKVICLEQLFMKLLRIKQLLEIRSAVCTERNVDRALSICFSCTTAEAALEQILAGLESYIAHLRSNCPSALVNS